jgi:hypothetical protein
VSDCNRELRVILTHDVSGVDWRFYRHLLSENVYDVYMKSWRDVNSTK